ncbi:FAD/NAD(P)-binding protein [Winogradskyella helgolandensis]|uniref:FAD/NAD(P)-binding protein n=1 Tax=Winogradskyella helgolandensis TaxID=2697010 RepID=UPI0015C8960D|nr:FAD/NAD(P)-binding protein [Winogradskyella helgolandensis]
METSKLAIIGSGPTALYILQHILSNSEAFLKQCNQISIFEKNAKMGYGMPYNPDFTDVYNIANISSEEIPELPQTLAEWLRAQDRDYLKTLNVTKFPIKATEVYSRISLGEYFRAQFNILIDSLKHHGFSIDEHTSTKVTDIKPISTTVAEVITATKRYRFHNILIATGHHWNPDHSTSSNYFDSPWPIFKLFNPDDRYYNFEIGILGASLSAIDVVTSLAHRHGKFTHHQNQLSYQLHPKAKGFKIVLHDVNGWLPHLQYEQVHPFREMYRYTTREALLALKKDNQNLFIETYFNTVCKPALLKALKKDELHDVVTLLNTKDFGFKQFIDTMAEKHEYINSFEGMRKELELADTLLQKNKPVHWMETLDDLMYSLNFHTELFSAEDHLFFHTDVKPFLMNVIAALPLKSAQLLLALYDANCIELVSGKVEIETKSESGTQIKICDSHDGVETKTYPLFINSSGNDDVTFDDFPFETLRNKGTISMAKAMYDHATHTRETQNTSNESTVTKEGELYLKLGGIAIDNTYRCLDDDGKPSQIIQDLAFNHIYGHRPYSYGLQACNATSCIVINALLDIELHDAQPIGIEIITKTYETKDDL